ncbi:hypothetical protein ABW19_dt0204944 [Dactylella cylindrospora]|nr:hypothetical protein ABW19_dt0204944 [Dactylella cylindrospora]
MALFMYNDITEIFYVVEKDLQQKGLNLIPIPNRAGNERFQSKFELFNSMRVLRTCQEDIGETLAFWASLSPARPDPGAWFRVKLRAKSPRDTQVGWLIMR